MKHSRTTSIVALGITGLVVAGVVLIGGVALQPAAPLAAWPPLDQTVEGGVTKVVVVGGELNPPGGSERSQNGRRQLANPREPEAEATTADGKLPDQVTVFDDQYAGVANLKLELLQALRAAADDAAGAGIEFYVTSGWRSSAYQNKLLREAIATYGSESEAARWVAAVDKSRHVSGEAVDIGGSDAETWLSKYGYEYGLCQIYHNEPWHFELRPEAVDQGCPKLYTDPTEDPRMR